MSLEVRPIRDDEMVDWVAAMHLAFHVNRSAAEEAEFRRTTRHQDLGRSLAAFDDGRVVGTYLSFPTELTLPGTDARVPADAVSGVAVVPTHHRRGLLTRMLRSDLETSRERGEVASALIAAEYPIYGRFGFGVAVHQASYRLQTSVTRFVRQPPGSVHLVDASQMRSVAPGVFDAVRRARAGQIDRTNVYWDMRLGIMQAPWNASRGKLHQAVYQAPDGTPTGYLLYRTEDDWQHHVPTGRLSVEELMALDADAYLGLWRYCAEVDLVGEVTAEMRPTSEPLEWLLYDGRKALQQTIRTDFLWVRPLDTPKFLAARQYVVEDQLTLEVDDPLGLAGGRFRLEGGPRGATCQPSQRSADLHLGISALSALCLGGVQPGVLAMAGLIDELTPGSLDRAARLFVWPVTPWCSTFF